MSQRRSGIMLCYPLEERRLIEPKFGWRFPVGIQYKSDGERAHPIGHMVHKEPFLISSECNPIVSVPHINQALIDQGIKKEVDGELYRHGWDFHEIHSVVSRKSIETLHPQAHQIKYHIYDYVSFSNKIQLERTNILMDMNLEDPLIYVPTYICNNFSEIMYYYDKFREQEYEGIIVRHLFKPYIRKRSRFILKFKPKKIDDYEIIAVNEAISKDGVPKGMVGSFTCHGVDGEEFNVGAGCLTHQQREDYWREHIYHNNIVGKYCRVQYQNIISGSGIPRIGLAVEVVS